MKKTIRKPENWQDFETLCKKLWGEIWQVPTKIKKNGRLGQPQAGVDIYAIAKNEVGYWGIQCKGKDEYVNARLTKSEIDAEILKAANFKPKLEVFIIATTANKDAEVEEYIRTKDLESRKAGGFEVLLYSWEDIVDLIEENRDTFNYYVNETNYHNQFDFKVYLNDFEQEFTIRPKFTRTVRKYRLKEVAAQESTGVPNAGYLKAIDRITSFNNLGSFNNSRVNFAIKPFEVIMTNEGTKVIEDWRVKIEVEGEFSKLMDAVGSGPMGMVDFTSLKYTRTYCKDNTISYRPKDNEPLIQKDNRYFEAFIIPLGKQYKIPIKWSLLARDYSTEGTVNLIVEPIYEDVYTYVEVESVSELLDDEVVSIAEKRSYK